jgi:predicted transcriptional regulator
MTTISNNAIRYLISTFKREKEAQLNPARQGVQELLDLNIIERSSPDSPYYRLTEKGQKVHRTMSTTR